MRTALRATRPPPSMLVSVVICRELVTAIVAGSEPQLKVTAPPPATAAPSAASVQLADVPPSPTTPPARARGGRLRYARRSGMPAVPRRIPLKTRLQLVTGAGRWAAAPSGLFDVVELRGSFISTPFALRSDGKGGCIARAVARHCSDEECQDCLIQLYLLLVRTICCQTPSVGRFGRARAWVRGPRKITVASKPAVDEPMPMMARTNGNGRSRGAQAHMSQRAVEQLLGRVITDSEFRRRFYEDAAAACAAAGLELTPRERAAVQALDDRAVRAFAALLDPRIVRAPLGPGRRTVVPARARQPAGK